MLHLMCTTAEPNRLLVWLCAGIKRRHPQLWLEVKMELHKDEQLCMYLDVMASADEVRLTDASVAP